MSKSGHVSGSDYPLEMPDRPLSSGNRPLSFQKSANCTPIDGNRHESGQEKTPFSTFWTENFLETGLQHFHPGGHPANGISGIEDPPSVPSCTESNFETGETEAVSGPDCPGGRPDRHLSCKNRPLSFSKSSICALIGENRHEEGPEKTSLAPIGRRIVPEMNEWLSARLATGDRIVGISLC